MHLFSRVKTKLKLSSAHHPQTDGQTERVNQILEGGLRNYIMIDQSDWSYHLSLLEFGYNSTVHTATGATPFELVLKGGTPITPLALSLQALTLEDLPETDVLADPKQVRDRNRAERWLYNQAAILENARTRMLKAQVRAAKQYNKTKREVVFQLNDMVWLRTKHLVFPERLSSKLIPRWVGPYKIIKKVGEVAYTLELPLSMRQLHPTFHVSNLKEYKPEDLTKYEGADAEQKWHPLMMELPVEVLPMKAILAERIQSSPRGPECKEYLILWGDETQSWEKVASLKMHEFFPLLKRWRTNSKAERTRKRKREMEH